MNILSANIKRLTLLILVLSFLITNQVIAKSTSSNGTGGGNWQSATTWTNGVPVNADNVTILAGDEVSYSRTGGGTDLKPAQLHVYGFLNHTGDKKIEVVNILNVYEGGKIECSVEVKLKGGTTGSASISGTIIADKFKIDSNNQSLVLGSSGNINVSTTLEIKKVAGNITIEGIIRANEVKLGDRNNNITIVGNGSISSSTYNLSSGSSIYGNGNPSNGSTVGAFAWTGETDGKWQLADNWSSGSVPTDQDDVIIPSEYITRPRISAGINASCNNLVLQTGAQIRMKSSLNRTASLYIYGTVSGTGEALVERHIPSDGWHIVSSPVTGQELGAFALDNALGEYDDGSGSTYDLAPYNEGNNNWGPFDIVSTTSTTFTTGKGYLQRLPVSDGDRDVLFTGLPFSGDVTVAVSNTNAGWNALGNPYTTAINARGTNGFLTVNSNKIPTNFLGVYLWDNAQDDYKVIAGAEFDFPDLEGAPLDTISQNEIAVGQGFVIKAKELSVDFTTDMQLHSNNTKFKSTEIPWLAFRLGVHAGELANSTIVSFNNQMTNGLDPMYDVGKLKGNEDIALYTKLLDGSSDIEYAIQALPESGNKEIRVPVGIDLPNGGEVIFYVEKSSTVADDVKVFIEDMHTKSIAQLDIEESTYSTIVEKETKGTGRFYLVFTNSFATGFNKPMVEEKLAVFNFDRTIVIEGKTTNRTRFDLYGIDGKKWLSKYADNQNRNEIETSAFPTGIYVLKILNKGNQQTQKLFIK